MAVFLDLDNMFSFLRTHGLLRSNTAISASLPTDKVPFLIPKIFAGFDVKFLLTNLVHKFHYETIQEQGVTKFQCQKLL